MKIKNNSVTLIAISLLFVVSCTNHSQSEKKVDADSTISTSGELLNQRSFEVSTAGDTTNIRDENGLKQGLWITNTGILLSNGGIKKDSVYYKNGQIQKK
jgi:hypothetical protein